MVQFLAVLNQTVQSGNIELVFFFNGSLESQRMNEWVAAQLKARQNINEVSIFFFPGRNVIDSFFPCTFFHIYSIFSSLFTTA